MTLKIIDVSSWNHGNGQPSDWQAVKAAGYVGVIIKATQGPAYVNPWFANDYAGATTAGLLVGAYHYAEPATSSPEVQAGHCHSVIAGCHLPLGVWLDFETTEGVAFYQAEQWCQTWMASIDSAAARAGLYLNLDFAGQYSGLAAVSRIWLANPSAIPNSVAADIIQTGQGAVPGVDGETDFDVIVNPRGLNLPVDPPPPPPPPPQPPNLPTLSVGTRGAAVEILQRDLNHFGAGLAVDGDFGPLTDEAVKAFQSANSLVVDGIVGPITWGALAESAAHPVAVRPGGEPELQEGSSGPAVVLLQRLLNETGARLAVDGDFGPLTRGAVVAFQEHDRLGADGIVGPITWGALRTVTA